MIVTEEFYNPPAKYRIKPFWFWNGEMTKETISHQIEEMAHKGLGGMFICARQGMTVPYLSGAWFELVEYACEEAKRWGLEAWLYDEYPYPSGMSGGEVLLEHPEAEHMVLNHKSLQVTGGREAVEEELGWSRVLFARAFRIGADGKTDFTDSLDVSSDIGNLQMEKIYQQTGLTAYNHKRFFSYGPKKILKTKLPEGEWRIEIYTESAMGDFKYYGGFFDPCNEEAVKTFIETTHERYRKAVGEKFGVSVHGMFSDEVGLLSPIPWSKKLPEAFEKRNGYSLLDHLPALHDETADHAFKVRYDLYETAHELFREAYHGQVAHWCQEHGLLYATEVPSMRLGTQRYSDIIGGDTAHEKLGKPLEWIYDEYMRNYRSNAKSVSSLSRQLDKPYAMIESFHSVGWTMTLQDAKWMIDRLGSSGINLYNFHAFYYTIQDITKHDAPPSQFLQNPYWKHYRKLADYVGRMGVMVSSTEADISVAVLDPAAALWTKLGNPFHGFSYAGESEKEKMECDALCSAWVSLCKELLFHQVDYDHLDAELLQEAVIEQGHIRLGRASYSVIVIPPCHCMEAGARKKLEEFVSQGGCLIGIGELPSHGIDGGEEDRETEDRWNALFDHHGTYHLPGNGWQESLFDLLEPARREPLRISVADGDKTHVVSSMRFDEEGGRYVFVSNQGGEGVTVHISSENEKNHGSDQLQGSIFDLESGKVYPFSECRHRCKPDGTGLSVRLGSFESCWLKIWAEKRGGEECVSYRSRLIIPFNGLWAVEAEGKNICRFAQVEMSLDRQEWKETEVKTFIEQCSDTKLLERQHVAFSGTFGTPKKMTPAYPITCWYRISFDAEEVPEDVALFMDRETIAGEFEIFVNGESLKGQTWNHVFVNDQNNREMGLAGRIHPGKNRIEFCVKIKKDEDGLRDPVYLRGSFGVADGVLTKMPVMACPDEHWCQGYPYYSGTLRYTRQLTGKDFLDPSSGSLSEQCLIELDHQVPMYDCMEVCINGCSLGVKAYTPYIWECGRDLLKEGSNDVTICVTNTLANMLDGTYFDYKSHLLAAIEEGELS